jgi:hypothetical protein
MSSLGSSGWSHRVEQLNRGVCARLTAGMMERPTNFDLSGVEIDYSA